MNHRWQKILIIVGGFLLLYLLWWRLKLGIERYFDIDEFAHIHWSYNVFRGLRPYTDFFDLFPPFLSYTLYPLWFFFGNPITVLVEARVMMFIFFVLLSGVVFLLAKGRLGELGILGGLLSVIIFSFLPIPYDKTLEIRPDLIATFFAFMGMYFLIRGIQGGRMLSGGAITTVYSRSDPSLFLSGLCYAIGIGFVPKIMFFLPAVFLVILYWWWRIGSHYKTRSHPGKRSDSRIRFWTCPAGRRASQNDGFAIRKMAIGWSAGFLLPLSILGVMLVLYGDPVGSFLQITKIPSDVQTALSNVYNHNFYMFPSHFFWQNQTYYGVGGKENFPYIVNLIIWIAASLWGVIRLVGFLSKEKTDEQVTELLVGSSFIFNFVAFTHIFPMKHAQYLIMLVPFVAFYFADLVVSMVNIFSKRKLEYLGIVVLCLLYIVVIKTTEDMNRPKSSWRNENDLNNIKKIVQTMPPDSYVFDLSGQSLIFRDPYYICCLPYGQYIDALPKLPSLRGSLEKTQTKYVFNTRFDTLPEDDRKYITETFTIRLADGLILSR